MVAFERHALLDDLAATVFPVPCLGCGRRGAAVCAACSATLPRAGEGTVPSGLDAFVAPLAYEGVARELVARVKYRNHRGALPRLARVTRDAVAPLVERHRIDTVTWAPTTPARRAGRGFDHAELVARRVARGLRLPARSLLERGPGDAQTGRSRRERRSGPVFVATPRARHLRVLLIDDVLTTGATMGAAALALRAGGATAVVGAAVARTP